MPAFMAHGTWSAHIADCIRSSASANGSAQPTWRTARVQAAEWLKNKGWNESGKRRWVSGLSEARLYHGVGIVCGWEGEIGIVGGWGGER